MQIVVTADMPLAELAGCEAYLTGIHCGTPLNAAGEIRSIQHVPERDVAVAHVKLGIQMITMHLPYGTATVEVL